MKVEYGDFPMHERVGSRGKYAPLLKDFLSNHDEPSMRILCSDSKEMAIVASSLRQLRGRLNANVMITTNGSDHTVYVTKFNEGD